MNRSRARAIRRKYNSRTRVTVRKAWLLSALAAAVIIYGAAARIRERAVSYTHLDVYKRQLQYPLRRAEKECIGPPGRCL